MNLTPARRPVVLLVGAVFIAASPPLMTPPLAVAADWAEEFQEGNFVFRSEFPLADSQDLLSELADLETELETALGVECGEQEIQIHFFRTRYSYRRYLSIRVPQGARRQAFYMPGEDAGRVYAYRHRDMATDLRHETTHALLRNAFPYLPLWLDEGLAEYFETEAGQRSRGNGHLGELRLAIRFGWRPDLQKLEAKRNFLEMRGQEYRDSWGIVHYLLHGPEQARTLFQEYLGDIADEEVPGPLSEVLGRAIPNYQDDIVRHLKDW